MRSRHAEKFNHDDEAHQYDADVADEGNPIRAGYSELLDWVASTASVTPSSSVLELGTGTGNLAARLGSSRRLVLVDVSAEMLRIARKKLSRSSNVEYVQADLLECFETIEGSFDAVVSTYAVHHLTEDEKSTLFHLVRKRLAPGGAAVFGDLMFANEEQRSRYLAELREAHQDELADEIEDEFFWNVETAVAALEHEGLRVETERVSELSWGVSARLAS